MSENANPIEPFPGEPPKKPKGDLGVRTLSAIVMVTVAGGAFWLGGWPWQIFLGLIGIGLFWEFWGLVRLLASSVLARAVWMLVGILYFGLALYMASTLSSSFEFRRWLLMFIGAVIATDVGAYFAGRSIGGPKIAPKISPSKTWAGLGGGMLLAGLFTFWFFGANCVIYDAPQQSISECLEYMPTEVMFKLFGLGMVVAVVAQTGDFFESWMKRRAGVKDSGSLIPGHGGLFDRVDGLIAVLCVAAVYFLYISRGSI